MVRGSQARAGSPTSRGCVQSVDDRLDENSPEILGCQTQMREGSLVRASTRSLGAGRSELCEVGRHVVQGRFQRVQPVVEPVEIVLADDELARRQLCACSATPCLVCALAM
jgi:hypothetical protein